MVEFKVHNIQQTNEFIEYLEYKLVVLTVPNLENYGVSYESVLNFQTKLFYDIDNLFWDQSKSPIYIRINRDDAYYKYIIRVTNLYNLKNIVNLEIMVNSLFKTFPFKYITKKRRQLSEEYISYKVQKMNIV
jgi:hypothetical protein